MKAKFSWGQLVATPNALARIPGPEIAAAFLPHIAGDWGDLVLEDKAENELSRREGFRLFSAYHSAEKVKFWIITEADRSVTAVLLPEDY